MSHTPELWSRSNKVRFCVSIETSKPLDDQAFQFIMGALGDVPERYARRILREVDVRPCPEVPE